MAKDNDARNVEELIFLNTQFPMGLANEINIEAAKSGVSRSEFMRQSLIFFLECIRMGKVSVGEDIPLTIRHQNEDVTLALQQLGSATGREIAKAATVHVTTAHYHLSQLYHNGLAGRSSKNLPKGRQYIYSWLGDVSNG